MRTVACVNSNVYDDEEWKLAATLRWFTAGVQSASLYNSFHKPGNYGHYYVIDDVITRKV